MRARSRPDFWHDTPVTETPCPSCGHLIDRAGNPDGAKPNPGDFSVCISCASILVFGEGLVLRASTPADLDRLDAEEAAELRRYQAAVRALDRREMKND